MDRGADGILSEDEDKGSKGCEYWMMRRDEKDLGKSRMEGS